uniref:Tail tubular protein A n=1 Tax=feces metagenome TaxID=1861841 RepID=A0A7M2QN83_9ZZZZ
MTFAINTLSAVNACLGTLGELPVNGVDEDHPLVPAALAKIGQETAYLQADLWWFNVEYPTLFPDPIHKTIRIPSDCVGVDSFTQYPRLAVRAGKLYNLDTGSDQFEAPLRVRLHRSLPFDDMPILARALVQARAARKFHADYDGDQAKMQRLSADEQQSYVIFNSEHIRNAKANMLNRSGVQNVLMHINPDLTTRRFSRIG